MKEKTSKRKKEATKNRRARAREEKVKRKGKRAREIARKYKGLKEYRSTAENKSGSQALRLGRRFIILYCFIPCSPCPTCGMRIDLDF